MATQSPGIYFKEIDNTAYENPKATSGTTVCVVGYAKKGPIGEPVKITSWANFVSVFGKPVDGYYSGLAVKNVLNAGGTILFERVADNSATPSNCIVKNHEVGYKGYVNFARAADILVGTNGYVNGSIYSLEVSDAENNKKVFFVKSPKEGKLTQNSIYSQLLAQNDADGISAFYEATINKNITPGLYSFKVSGTDVPEMGDVYVNLATSNTEKLFTETVNKALSTGSNATCALRLSNVKANGFGSPFDVNSAINISGVKKFKIVINGKASTIEVSLAADDTFEDLAAKLNTKCNNYNVHVFIQGIEVNEGESYPHLIFVLMNKGEGNTLDVENLSSEDLVVNVNEETGEIENTNQLFTSSNFTSDGSNVSGIGADENADFSVKVYEKETTINSASVLEGFTVSYDENVNSIILTSDAKGSEAEIGFEKGSKGKFLLDFNTGKQYSYKGQDYLNVNIERRTDKKIYFVSTDNLSAPALSNYTSEDADFLNLLDIEKDPNDFESVGYEGPVEGKDAVEPSNKDMVVFTSKESGSATNNIEIEVYTSVSPVDGTVKHDLTIKVDGLLKETYEDISYNYADVDNRFDTKINEAVENGGSSYINCTVVKNDYADADVQLPDGVYYIGKPNNAEDVAKDADVSYSAYALYDYAVGSDGIPADDGSSLFEEALTVGTSKLANRDLYDFHILITPDDITETVQTAAIALCEDRGDAIAIIDPPIGLGVKEVINWHNGRGYGRASAPTSNFAATYWPWCKIYDNSTGTGKFTWVMPSVVMAAKYVSVDKTAGCWYAPAGEQNGQLAVYDIEQYPNKLDRDALYVDYNRVNPITKFKDGTIVVYGEKTLQRINSVLTKIHTRRMLVQIKKQCREALRGYIFMPNTTDYLGKISSNMSAILETYKAGGGLESYKVVCNETNNTTETRQQDIVNVDVLLVPTGCIEQINISLTLNKSEETVSSN